MREATSEGMAGVEGGLSEKSANNEPIACVVDVLYTYCTIAKTFSSHLAGLLVNVNDIEANCNTLS